MKLRTYKVGHTKGEESGDYLRFFVTDCHSTEELNKGLRPNLAEFPVTQLYDADEQEQRAQQYADFLNKIQQATQKAYEQTLMMDILKS